jgi:hypothetical protein
MNCEEHFHEHIFLDDLMAIYPMYTWGISAKQGTPEWRIFLYLDDFVNKKYLILTRHECTVQLSDLAMSVCMLKRLMQGIQYVGVVLLQNGGYCNGCITERCLHNSRKVS